MHKHIDVSLYVYFTLRHCLTFLYMIECNKAYAALPQLLCFELVQFLPHEFFYQ